MISPGVPRRVAIPPLPHLMTRLQLQVPGQAVSCMEMDGRRYWLGRGSTTIHELPPVSQTNCTPPTMMAEKARALIDASA